MDIPDPVGAYINAFPNDVRLKLNQLRRVIREEAPRAEETIKYRMPAYVCRGNLVFFAAFKTHIGFYPIPTGIKAFKKELSAYKTSKGAIQFPLDQPLPLALIRKIIRFRLKENREKA